MSPTYLLKILCNITHSFACSVVLMITRRARKISGYYLDQPTAASFQILSESSQYSTLSVVGLLTVVVK